MSIFEEAKKKTKELIEHLFDDERKAHIDDIVTTAMKQMPRPTFGDYKTHMERRHMYRLGAMQLDMKEVLKRRFPKTHEEIEQEQVNLKIYKRENAERSKTFLKTGRFYLVDEKGEEVEDENFDEFVHDSQLFQSFVEMDRARRSEERCMFKPWWNESKQHVSIDIWPVYMTYIVPNPDPLKRYDVDQALLVAFEHAGLEGPADQDKILECWSILPEDMQAELGKRTLHFMSSKKGDYQINPDDTFDYEDPRESGKPIYPFTWFKHDRSTNIYVIGDEDALTANRMVNSGMTDVVQGMHVMMFGTWVHKKGDDGKELSMQTMGGGRVIELGEGEELDDLTPQNLPIDQYLNFWERYLQMSARLENLSASVIEKQEPDVSGEALKVRRIGQIEDREEQIPIIREDVEMAIYRGMIVHNAHCKPEKQIKNLEKVWPKWDPGQPDVPTDEEKSLRVKSARKEMNMTTPVHERMEETGEDFETAKKAIEEMAALNKELAKISSAVPLVERAFDFKDRKEKEADEEEDDDEDENGKKKPVPPQPKKGGGDDDEEEEEET